MVWPRSRSAASRHPVGEGGLHRVGRAEDAVHAKRLDRCGGEVRPYVVGEREIPDDMELQRLALRAIPLQCLRIVGEGAEHEGISAGGAAQCLAMALQLALDRRPDELRAIGIKALVHEQLDLPEVY